MPMVRSVIDGPADGVGDLRGDVYLTFRTDILAGL
jgi:hypothetical protein